MSAYEVTMMYRVVLPEGTEGRLEKEFGSLDEWAAGTAKADLSEVMTELISEVQNRHVAEIESHTGTSKQTWVYMGSHTMWNEGWYHIENMPTGFGEYGIDYTVDDVKDWTKETYSGGPRVVIEGIECSMINWIWSGE
jgi:hypothetical protein